MAADGGSGGRSGRASRERRTKLTVRDVAERYGVSEARVRRWIQAGDLAAIDGAAGKGERPRYLIDEKDLADFDRRRAVGRRPAPAPRAARRPDPDVIEFI